MLGRIVKQREIFDDLRHEFGISYFALGERRCESFKRRGKLAHIYDIDERNKYLYPVIDFSNKEVEAYVKLHNLPIGEEYKVGFKHDLNTPDAKALLYIKHQYPDDYRKIITTFPNLEAGVKRLEMYGSE